MSEPAAFVIRPEGPGEGEAIRALTEAAFATAPHAGGDEADIIERLRAKGTLALSLVAARGEGLVGQVTLSPAKAADRSTGWYALGPISVDPAEQRKGIASALIRAAIAWMEARGAAGCVLVGEPGFYGRFGFVVRPDCVPDALPGDYYQVLPLECEPAAIVDFDPAFFGP